jgi:hypothetical protein
MCDQKLRRVPDGPATPSFSFGPSFLASALPRLA